MALAAPLRNVAAKLLKQFGRTATFTRKMTGAFNAATDSVAITNIETEASVVISEYTERELRGPIRSGDKKMLAAASDFEVVPDTDWTVRVGNLSYEVVHVTTHQAEDQSVLLELAVRGL